MLRKSYPQTAIPTSVSSVITPQSGYVNLYASGTSYYMINELGNSYDLADKYTKVESDDRYVNITGDTMTGGLTLSSGTTANFPLKFQSGSLLNTTEQGAVEYVDNDLYFSIKTPIPSIIYTSEYPSPQDVTTVKATTFLSSDYYPHFATDPTKSLIGSLGNNQWSSNNGVIADQRFHIDLGSTKIITKVYYENGHNIGNTTDRGVKNFTLWGSNTQADFDDLIYANDGTWVELSTDVSLFEEHVALNQVDPKYVYVTNTTGYRYYAFKFADNWGGTYSQLRRVELQSGDINTRRGIILNDGANLTETYLPVATTNGRLTDSVITQVNDEILIDGSSLDTYFDNNFLSANTSYYTQTEVDNNFLSATTISLETDQIAFGNGSNKITGSSNLTWDDESLFINGRIDLRSVTSRSTIIGQSAGNTTMTGVDNTLIGYRAGYQSSGGTQNTIVGSLAASFAVFSGIGNSLFGYQAGYKITSGDQNTIMGYSAGSQMTTQRENTFIGILAGGNSTGSYNTFLGSASGYENPGTYNVMIGKYTGQKNTGNNNTFLGSTAGYDSGAASSCVFIGYNVGRTETSNSKLYIDNSSTSTPLIYGDFTSNYLRIHNSLFLPHIAAPTQQVGYGGLYVDTANSHIYFINESGSTWDLTDTGTTDLSGYYTSAQTSANFLSATTISLATDQIAFGSGSNEISGSSNLSYNDESLYINGRLNIQSGVATSAAIGLNAGNLTMTGLYNAIFGAAAGNALTDGASNTFIGAYAGVYTEGGENNTFIGNSAGYSNVDGINNVIIGYQAGYSNIANYNNFFGYEAGYSNSDGLGNLAFGYASGYENISGDYNISIGYLAGYNNLASETIYIGHGAGQSTTGATNGIGIGTDSLKNCYGASNLAIGYKSGDAVGFTGANNVILGHNTGSAITTGYNNVLIGNLAGYKVTEGFKNILIGYQSGYDLIDGDENICIGDNAGANLRSGFFNFFTGRESGNACTDGSYNIGIGTRSLYKVVSAQYNVALGIGALEDVVTGEKNTAIGYHTGNNTTGSSNVFIGYDAGSDELGSSKLYIANTNTTTPLIHGDFSSNHIRIHNSLFLPLISTPTEQTGYGGFYVNAINALPYFVDESGNTFNLTDTGSTDLSDYYTSAQTSDYFLSANTISLETDHIAFGNGSNTITGSSNLTWDGTTFFAKGSGAAGSTNILEFQNSSSNGILTIADNGYFLFSDGTNNLMEIEGVGIGNVHFGYEAGDVNSGTYNVGIGYRALKTNTQSYCVGIGYLALTNNTGTANVAIGSNALDDALTGGNNTAIGNSTGGRLTSGNNNVLIGAGAGSIGTESVGLVAIGTTSNTTDADYTVAIGYQAGYQNAGNNCVLIGTHVAYVSTGIDNTFIGAYAGKFNKEGYNNTYLGRSAGYINTGGTGNVFIGHSAGYSEYYSNKLYIANSNTTTPLIYGEFDNDFIKVHNTLFLPHIATPTEQTGYGGLYVSEDDSHIYFVNESGTTWDLTNSGSSGGSVTATDKEILFGSGNTATSESGLTWDYGTETLSTTNIDITALSATTIFSDNVYIDEDGFIYWGPTNTEGSWRQGIDHQEPGRDLVVEVYSGGTWVEKTRYNA